MIALCPKQRVVDEKRCHFSPPEIVNCSLPVRVLTEPRIFMFIKRSAIKTDQTMRVGRKVRWHPVDQYTKTGTMRAVDKTRQPLDFAKARRWRVKTCGLVTPAWIIGIFADW